MWYCIIPATYIQNRAIDTIWLNHHHKSPQNASPRERAIHIWSLTLPLQLDISTRKLTLHQLLSWRVLASFNSREPTNTTDLHNGGRRLPESIDNKYKTWWYCSLQQKTLKSELIGVNVAFFYPYSVSVCQGNWHQHWPITIEIRWTSWPINNQMGVFGRGFGSRHKAARE